LEYFLSKEAENDIDEIITYLSHESSEAAYAFLDSLFQMMNKLSQFPEMGHFREDLTHRPVRFLTFKWHYQIIYCCDESINVVRVLSGYRDIVNLL
jgi:plasmid stabilization system protein ParE